MPCQSKVTPSGPSGLVSCEDSASLGFLLLVQLKLLTSICLAGVAVGLCPDEAATPAPLKSPRREARSFHDLPALRKNACRVPDPGAG